MAKITITPTDKEHFLRGDDLIVSKTDVKGHITYINEMFRKISQFSDDEVLGKPHNIIRHPDMPRSIFKLLWNRLSNEQEIFAYVKNICKNGDFYWVMAHVTPSYNIKGELVGYHSNRRAPSREHVAVIETLYKKLISMENSYPNKKDGMNAAYDTLMNIMENNQTNYDQFAFETIEFYRNMDLSSNNTELRKAG